MRAQRQIPSGGRKKPVVFPLHARSRLGRATCSARNKPSKHSQLINNRNPSHPFIPSLEEAPLKKRARTRTKDASRASGSAITHGSRLLVSLTNWRPFLLRPLAVSLRSPLFKSPADDRSELFRVPAEAHSSNRAPCHVRPAG